MTGLRESSETLMQDSLTSKSSLNTGNIYLKGHSQLVHTRITYHSIANLHKTETR